MHIRCIGSTSPSVQMLYRSVASEHMGSFFAHILSWLHLPGHCQLAMCLGGQGSGTGYGCRTGGAEMCTGRYGMVMCENSDDMMTQIGRIIDIMRAGMRSPSPCLCGLSLVSYRMSELFCIAVCTSYNGVLYVLQAASSHRPYRRQDARTGKGSDNHHH